MIGILLKNWKTILDILLVIALVVLIFMWNPFSIFGGGLKLTPTANMVTQIREIGQLVTSEYYGEVIASIEESRMNYLEEDETTDRALRLYDGLYEAMVYLDHVQASMPEVKQEAVSFTALINGRKNILHNKVSRRNILDKLSYYNLLEDFSSEPLYGDVLEYLWSSSNPKKKWKGSSRNKEEALMALYSEAEKGREAPFEEARFSEFYYQKKSLEVSKKEKKKKLAMVGRGWVKAGFDFSRLDNNNFYINEEAGEVHFFGLSATILNSDINPWFIPELGIPGFEILDYNGKVDFRDAKKVKQYCVEKLVVKAHQAEILKYAEANGADLLKNLFSLMTGKEIKFIFFHNDPLLLLSQEIARDEFVSYYEAVFFDSLIVEERKIIDSLQTTRENSYKNQQVAEHREESVKRTIGLLQKLPFEDLPGNFNVFSRITFEIARDSMMDRKEWEKLKTIRKDLLPVEQGQQTGKKESYTENLLAQAGLFNSMIHYFMAGRVVAGSVADTLLPKAAFSEAFLSQNRLVSYGYTHKDSLQARLFVEEVLPDQKFLDLLYPFLYDSLSWEHIAPKRRIVVDSIPLNRLASLVFNDSTSLVYERNPSPHFKVLNRSPKEWIEPLLLKSYSDDGILWISENIAVFLKDSSKSGFTPHYKAGLTATQSEELEGFYYYLLKSHSDENRKGPIIRANEWLQNKFENHNTMVKWSSQTKNRLIY